MTFPRTMNPTLSATLLTAFSLTAASGCTWFRGNSAKENADERAEAIRENAEKRADSIEESAERSAEAVPDASNANKGGTVDSSANLEKTGEASAQGVRDAAEVLADAIEKCPILGLRDSKQYVTTTSPDYVLNASKAGQYACFTNEADAKQAGFVASSGTGVKTF